MLKIKITSVYPKNKLHFYNRLWSQYYLNSLTLFTFKLQHVTTLILKRENIFGVLNLFTLYLNKYLIKIKNKTLKKILLNTNKA